MIKLLQFGCRRNHTLLPLFIKPIMSALMLSWFSMMGYCEPAPNDVSVTLSKNVEQFRARPYDDEMFTLAYKTFMYNAQTKAAFLLASIATEKQPQSLVWQERLAQTALWNSQDNVGIKAWLFVAQHTQNIKLIKEAALMAKLFGFDGALVQILKIYLKKVPHDQQAMLDLANSQNRLFLPNKALSTLRTLNQSRPNKAAYELMANIFQDIDQWENALKTWQTMDLTFGVSVKNASAEAVIYYTQGQYADALNALKKAIPVAKSSDTDFWQTMGELAWMLNNRTLALKAYTQNLKNESNLIQIIELEYSTNPEKALFYSQLGYRHFKNPLFFSYAISLAIQEKQWQTVSDLLLSLSGNALTKASNNITFWEAQIQGYEALGREDLQKMTLVQGINLHPELHQLSVSLLWLVITNGEYGWIKPLMQMGYQQNYWQKPVWWHAFAEGFDVMNRFFAALKMYQQHLFQADHNDQITIDYANVLQRANLNQQAYDVWHFLWAKLSPALNQANPINKEQLGYLCQVAPLIASGTLQIQLFSALFGEKFDSQDINIFLNWIVPRRYFELIAYLKAFYLSNRLPDWAAIHLALAHNDLPELQRIMTHQERSWPRSDRINAAVRLENIPLALELAFNELNERPKANEIYTEFVLYGIHHTNFASLATELEKFVNVSGKRAHAESKLRLDNAWALRSDLSVWNPHSDDLTTITNVPTHDSYLNFKFEQKIHRGSINYSLGYRNALSHFFPLSTELNYMLNGRWTLTGLLGYNQESYENAYMRLGGVKDQINLGVLGTFSLYDSFTAQLQGNRYYSQDRAYLADGYNLFTLLQHKLWLGYPDYTLGLFGNLYHFNRNGSFAGNVTHLFPTLPAEQQNNPSLINAEYQVLIPNTYHEAGFTFSFGNEILDYTHRWRPYFWASLYYNTITYLSNNIKIGLNGSVFGRDSLVFYGERGTSQSTKNQTNYLIGVRYRAYF